MTVLLFPKQNTHIPASWPLLLLVLLWSTCPLHIYILPLKTPAWLCRTDFPVAGRREEAAGSSACVQNKEAHCYSLSTQRLSGPDKRAWAPWVTEMDGDPRARAPHTLPVCVSLALGDSFEKTLMLGKIEGRRRHQQRMRWLDGITDSMDMSLGQIFFPGNMLASL